MPLHEALRLTQLAVGKAGALPPISQFIQAGRVFIGHSAARQAPERLIVKRPQRCKRRFEVIWERIAGGYGRSQHQDDLVLDAALALPRPLLQVLVKARWNRHRHLVIAHASHP